MNYPEVYEQTKNRRLPTIPTKYQKLYLRVLEDKASPREAIKCNCLECVGWVKEEVARCTAPACPLYLHRPYQDPTTVFPRPSTGDVALAGGTNRPQDGPEAL